MPRCRSILCRLCQPLALVALLSGGATACGGAAERPSEPSTGETGAPAEAPQEATFQDDFESGDTRSWAETEDGTGTGEDGSDAGGGADGGEGQRPPER
jgi:hypothetical protein